MTEPYPFHESAIYQLNLILWLTWSNNPITKSGIFPIFHHEGYKLVFIGKQFSTSLQARTLAKENQLPFQPNPKPEMVLVQDTEKILLLIECKKSAFKLDNRERCAQANALLSLTGAELIRTIGTTDMDLDTEDWNSLALFAVKGRDESLMYDTLVNLSNLLIASKIMPSESATIGIYADLDGVTLKGYPVHKIPLKTLRDEGDNGIQVLQLEDGEDPRKLFLIPFDPTVPDEFPEGINILEERIRIAFVSLLVRRSDEDSDFEITLDEILERGLEYWRYWKDTEATTHIRKKTLAFVRSVVKELQDIGIKVEIQTKAKRAIIFKKVTPHQAHEIRRLFSSKSIKTMDVFPPPSNQLGFDEHSEEWE